VTSVLDAPLQRAVYRNVKDGVYRNLATNDSCGEVLFGVASLFCHSKEENALFEFRILGQFLGYIFT